MYNGLHWLTSHMVRLFRIFQCNMACARYICHVSDKRPYFSNCVWPFARYHTVVAALILQQFLWGMTLVALQPYIHLDSAGGLPKAWPLSIVSMWLYHKCDNNSALWVLLDLWQLIYCNWHTCILFLPSAKAIMLKMRVNSFYLCIHMNS